MNISGFTVSNNAIEKLQELAFKTIFSNPAIEQVCTPKTGLTQGQRVGYLDNIGAVGMAGAGCDPTYTGITPTGEEKQWSLKAWEIAKKLCYKDIESTIAQDSLKKGTDIANLMSGDYMKYVITPLLDKAITEFFWRTIWFGDTEAKNVAETDGGVITAGVNLSLVKVCDGLWKKATAIAAANTAQKTAISANTKSTYAAARTEMWTSGKAVALIDSIINDSDARIGDNGGVIIVNGDLLRAFENDVVINRKNATLEFSTLMKGVKVTEYRGVKLIGVNMWDQYVKEYEKSATGVYNLPYRAIYAPISNLMFGTDDTDKIPSLSTTFDDITRNNYIYMTSKIGTMIGEDELIHVAY